MRRPHAHARLFLCLTLACALGSVALGGAIATFQLPMASPARYIVALEENVPLPLGSFHQAPVVAQNDELDFVVVEASEPALLLGALAGDARVRYVEPDASMRVLWTPNDARYSEQYAIPKINAQQAWDVTKGSTSVILAIGDSGLDTSHPDIGRLLAGADFTGSGGLTDGCGHGTHVTGIAGATAGNGAGIAGVAQVSILPVKVIKSSCAGSFSQIASGIQWAADRGADVISLSLGCRGCTSAALTDAIRYATNTRGALVVVAAGNSGCSGCVNFPATMPEVIAVGCTTSTDATCSFSSRGPEVDIAAPGQSILSTEKGARYGMRSGTSMAAPHVSAVAALVLSKEPGLSVSALRNRLLSTAQDLGPAGPDDATGYGLVDAAAALGVSGAPTPPPTNSTPPASPPPPPPPTAYFSENFDDANADGWALTGLWRIGNGGCLGATSTPHSLQYNQASTCNYSTGARTTGTAQFTVDLDDAPTAKLSFATRHQVEKYAYASYDRLRVLVSDDNGATWATLYSRDSKAATSGWQSVSFDIGAYRSQATIVRFEFDSVDATANAYAGWAVDDVKIQST